MKHKKILIVGLLIVFLVCIFWDCTGNSAEDTAVKFVENMLDGKAEKCADLMTDDLIGMSDYETKKLFVYAFEKTLDAKIESYKAKYGKMWKYEVNVIDSFEYEPEYYDYDGDEKLVKVILEVKHTGSGLFNDKEGTEELSLIMELLDGEWLVYDL